MKGFTRNNKFIPMTDYKKVTRKSRDQKAKTQGVRMKKTNVSSIKAGGTCFCGRTSVKGGLCPSCRDNGVFFEKLKIEQAQQNPKNVGAMQRKAKTISIPKLHRVPQQEEGRVKFWAESSNGKTVSSLVQSKDFADEMELRIALPDFETITVRGSKEIMDNLTFDEFVDKTNMHLERQHLMREKREPFPVGERRPTGLGDQDVIEAISGKKTTQADLIAMQRQPRKARVPPDATKKELIKMLDGRFTELTGGDFVPATNFDFKNFKKEQVGQILEGSVEIPKEYYAIRDQKSGLIELRQKRFKPDFKRGREHPHDVIAIARDLPELESMIKTIKGSK